MAEILAKLSSGRTTVDGTAAAPFPPCAEISKTARRRRLAFPRGSDALLLIAVLAIGIALLGLLPGSFNVDSWLSLVAGRDIWSYGLPHHETLTAMSHGQAWIDQQWLSQLVSYVVYRLGGLGLLGLINDAMMILGVGWGVLYARRRGARPWIVMVLLALCLFQIVPSREVRTQAFAIPLIVATVILLSADSRRPSRRVYWCLPLIILWGNLHGTASIGACLVGLRGLTLAWERRGALRRGLNLGTAWAQVRRPLALTLGAPICLLLTPYGLGIVSYYRSTLGSGPLRHAVTEWQPITSMAVEAIPFFVLAGLTVWSFGRQQQRTTTWEKITLLVLAAGSIEVIRNALLFGLAALVIIPFAIDGAVSRSQRRPAPVRDKLNAALCWMTLTILAVASLFTLVRPASTYEYRYQRPRLLAVVRTATQRDPAIKVLADVRFADWLLWRDPQLRGRLASDARFELLSAADIVSLERVFNAVGPQWKQGANGYRVIVLDRTASPDAVNGFLEEPGHHVLYDDGQRVVIQRSAGQAG
jgi:hypothetical protein